MDKNKIVLDVLETYKKDDNRLYVDVAEYIANDVTGYDDYMGFFGDLRHGGCVSGFVRSLIYYKDTHEFFDNFYHEIMGVVEEYEEQTGEKPQWQNDLKNWFAWFAFEYVAFNIERAIEDKFEEESV